MHGLAGLMDPGDFTNTSDTRLAVSRVITWTTEPKSQDVRKAAQAVLIALFNLNTPEFSMLLSALPKTFQVNAGLQLDFIHVTFSHVEENGFSFFSFDFPEEGIMIYKAFVEMWNDNMLGG